MDLGEKDSSVILKELNRFSEAMGLPVEDIEKLKNILQIGEKMKEEGKEEEGKEEEGKEEEGKEEEEEEETLEQIRAYRKKNPISQNFNTPTNIASKLVDSSDDEGEKKEGKEKKHSRPRYKEEEEKISIVEELAKNMNLSQDQISMLKAACKKNGFSIPNTPEDAIKMLEKFTKMKLDENGKPIVGKNRKKKIIRQCKMTGVSNPFAVLDEKKKTIIKKKNTIEENKEDILAVIKIQQNEAEKKEKIKNDKVAEDKIKQKILLEQRRQGKFKS